MIGQKHKNNTKRCLVTGLSWDYKLYVPTGTRNQLSNRLSKGVDVCIPTWVLQFITRKETSYNHLLVIFNTHIHRNSLHRPRTGHMDIHTLITWIHYTRNLDISLQRILAHPSTYANMQGLSILKHKVFVH